MSSSNLNPLLTIVIPTYNSAETLGTALESVIHQTFRDIEVIIIDGMSSDNTVQIAKKYQLNFPHIKIISEPDKGIYDAMNKGVGMAQGEWVYFMGGDDSIFEPTTFEKIFQHENLENIEIIYGDVYFAGLNKIYDGEFTYSKLITKNICHQAILYRIRVFEKMGKFNIKYKVLADWDHNIKWFYSSKISKSYTNQIIANFGKGGISSKYVDERFIKDKSFNVIINGLRKLEKSELISLVRNALRYAKNDNSWYRIYFLLTLKYFLIIRRKIGV